MRAVRENPGIHKSELCRVTGLGWGTVGYQLGRLRASGRISGLSVNGRFVVFPSTIQLSDGLAIQALRRPPARIALTELQGAPRGLTELAKEGDVSRKVMRRHLRSLVDAGLVTRGEGHRGRFELTRSGRQFIRESSELDP